MAKLSVCHFHNGIGGGVLSVIRNLLLYRWHDEIENHVIYTIDMERIKDFKIPGLEGATTEKIFYYSPKWNFYHTCRQLAKLLPDDKAVIVAHDWLELGLVSNLGLQNPLLYFLHGNYDYYYNLAFKHNQWIDRFICVASAIEQRLVQLLPERKESIIYKRFPVRENNYELKKTGVAKAVFIGRCEKAKGFDLLPKIAERLVKEGIELEWHIIGEGSSLQEVSVTWPPSVKLLLHGLLKNDEVLHFLPGFDYLIFPSLAEGMPLTVIEAMKAGVIPIVNDLEGGLQELVINETTGYCIKGNDVNVYAEKICMLENTPELKKTISVNAVQLSNNLFDPQENTAAIEKLFYQLISEKRYPKAPKKIYGSRLDQRWVPNLITYNLRRF